MNSRRRPIRAHAAGYRAARSARAAWSAGPKYVRPAMPTRRAPGPARPPKLARCGPGPARTEVLPVELIVRESARAPGESEVT
jgi:hypothetical protein